MAKQENLEHPPGQETSLRNRLDQAEVETKAKDLIENVLKPKHVHRRQKGTVQLHHRHPGKVVQEPSTSSRPTPAQVRTPSRPRSSRSLLGWSLSVSGKFALYCHAVYRKGMGWRFRRSFRGRVHEGHPETMHGSHCERFV